MSLTSESIESPLSRNSQILLLVLLIGIYHVICISRIVLAPLLPVIETEFGLSHTRAGTFFIIIAMSYSVGIFGSGFISSCMTHRGAIVLAVVALGLALLLIASSNSLLMIHFGLFLLGMFSGIYFPSGMTIITTSISREHWGKAIAFHELAPTLAYIIAPFIVEAILLLFRWQLVFVIIGISSVLLGLTFLHFAPGNNIRGEAPTFRNIRFLIRKPAFWIMTILFCFAASFTIGLYSMMPLYLVAERGIDRSVANTIVGLSRVPVLVTAIFSGWITDRFGPKPTLIVVLLFTGLMTILLGVLPGRWVILLVFIQPMLTVCFSAPGFTILSRIAPPESRNLSVSLTMFIAYLTGAGFIPAAFGILGDAGAFWLAFIIFGSLMVLSALLVVGLDLQKIEK